MILKLVIPFEEAARAELEEIHKQMECLPFTSKRLNERLRRLIVLSDDARDRINRELDAVQLRYHSEPMKLGEPTE